MKKTLGFYFAPFPSFIKKENCNSNHGKIINTNNIFNFKNGSSTLFIKLAKEMNYNYTIIPYNIDEKTIDEYLYEIDAFIVFGNFTSNYNENNEINIHDLEHKKHFKTLELFYNKILDINKNERFIPIIGLCYGYELLTKIIEKIDYKNNKFLDYTTPIKIYNNSYLNKKYEHNYKSGYDFNIVFNSKNLIKTKYLKKDYEVISLLDIDLLNSNNISIVETFKHKLYPIFFTKDMNLIKNKIIKDELCKYIDLSFKFRENKFRKTKISYKFKKIKSKNIECILKEKTYKNTKNKGLKKSLKIFLI